MREKARKLVFKYVNEHQDDLLRTWATERPVRAVPARRRRQRTRRRDLRRRWRRAREPRDRRLQDVDRRGAIDPLQLQVYADAGRREGLTVQGALIHDMSRHPTSRSPSTSPMPTIADAEAAVISRAEVAATA